MKAKDLMIGDWVAFRGRPYRYTAKDLATMDECEQKGIGTDTTAIPLTAEILEKNGFERYGTSYIIRESIFELTNPSNPDRYFDNYYIRLARQNKRVMYVHELQHFMKMFGIKKEIEL